MRLGGILAAMLDYEGNHKDKVRSWDVRKHSESLVTRQLRTAELCSYFTSKDNRLLFMTYLDHVVVGISTIDQHLI